MDKDMETGDDPKSPLRGEHPQPQNPGVFPLLSPFRARTADLVNQSFFRLEYDKFFLNLLV